MFPALTPVQESLYLLMAKRGRVCQQLPKESYVRNILPQRSANAMAVEIVARSVESNYSVPDELFSSAKGISEVKKTGKKCTIAPY